MARNITLLLLLTGIELAAQSVRFGVIDPTVVEARFNRLEKNNAQRADAIRTLFMEAGCGASLTEQVVKDSKLPNFICTLAGSTDRQVVVTAHYDKVEAGEGAVDNWSGAAILSSLYQSLSAVPRTLTFVFLATTDAEKRLVGARGYWEQLSLEDRFRIQANVNVIGVGVPGSIYVWEAQADPGLVSALAAVVKALDIPVYGVDFPGTVSDSSVFLRDGIPAIDFTSTTPEMKLRHTSKDVRGAIDQPTYYSTFRLIAGFLAFLDAQAAGVPAP